MVNKRKTISGSENQTKSSALVSHIKRQKECEEGKQGRQSSDASNYDDTGHLITMPPVTLKGDTLGEKCKHFNKLVEDAIANKNYNLRNIGADDSDIDNLLKIVIASKTRNVDYIIKVIKSNDLMYAATAIKKSTWLITEQQYANIINPEYLHTKLLPSMNTKTFNKLLLHIRLNLKDESRVETFYEYLKESDSSYKWLENCSIPFIENVIKNERLIPVSLFKRLCKRSTHFLKYHTRVESQSTSSVTEEILFLLKSCTTDVLNILEDTTLYNLPEIGKKKTKFLIKTCPQRIINQFDRYVYKMEMSVVAKYLNKKEIKSFICKQGVDYLHYDTLKYFIKNMPEVERFEFVRKTFIEKSELSLYCTEKSYIKPNINPYKWYEFAPFNVAFTELKKIIRAEKSPAARCAMLSILIICANRNHQHIKTLLEFFKDKHFNEPFKFKIKFVNNVLSQIFTHELDVETWNVLDQLFHSMKVYTVSESKIQLCLQSIVLYKVLHNEPVPEIVEQKFKITFNSFKNIQSQLNQGSKSKMFTYLLNKIMKKQESKTTSDTTTAFAETLSLIEDAMTLLKDWNMNILNYPYLLQKIQELIKLNQEKTLKIDMSCLYNVNKSWRKHMFEESLSLYLCEETCLNALKHKPQLLTRYDKEIDTLRTNDAVSLRRLLTKLRVYWPQSLAQQWTDIYLLNLNKPTGQKAAVRGLFTVHKQNQVIDMARKHAPDDSKINWGETDQADVNIRKNIAKNLHITRPLIPLDIILWYAKGDYLQHAVLSLNPILSMLSEVDSREHVSKLLEAPVSLQKFGLRLAFFKLNSDEQMSIFRKIWSTTKNLTIRSVIFKLTHAQLCKVKNPSLEKDLWELLISFIDNLSPDENTDIYDLLALPENIPISVRAEYYVKSYMFLTSLPASANCETYVERLIQFAPTIMDSLDDNFVNNNILSPAGPKFWSCDVYGRPQFTHIFACYVLCGKNEDDQLQKFRLVVDPVINEAFKLWDTENLENRNNFRSNFDNFLNNLVSNFRIYYFNLKEIPIPAKLFVEILTIMKKNMSLIDNYVLYTSWKLTTEYIKLMKELSTSFNTFESGKLEDELKISPSLGSKILECLKEDTEQYESPVIYNPFTDAFEKMFKSLAFQYDGFKLETIKHMLNDCEFVPCFLMVSKAVSNMLTLKFQRERSEIRKKIESHPSATVRLHYFSYFQDVAED